MKNNKMYNKMLYLSILLSIMSYNCGGGGDGEEGNYINPKLAIKDNFAYTCSSGTCESRYDLEYHVEECTKTEAVDPFCGSLGRKKDEAVSKSFKGSTEAVPVAPIDLPFDGRVSVWVEGTIYLKDGVTTVSVNTFTKKVITTVKKGFSNKAGKPLLGTVTIGTNGIGVLASVQGQGSGNNIMQSCTTETQYKDREVCVPATSHSERTPGCWFRWPWPLDYDDCYITCHVAGICYTEVIDSYNCHIVTDTIQVTICL